mgnify:CR=1 FL=1
MRGRDAAAVKTSDRHAKREWRKVWNGEGIQWQFLTRSEEGSRLDVLVAEEGKLWQRVSAGRAGGNSASGFAHMAAMRSVGLTLCVPRLSAHCRSQTLTYAATRV